MIMNKNDNEKETIKMIRAQTDNLTLIVELGSNSMKRGFHDKRLYKNNNLSALLLNI